MNRQQTGFTLVESLVTVVIFGLLASVVGVAALNTIDTQRTNEVLYRLSRELESGRNEARTTGRPITLSVENRPEGPTVLRDGQLPQRLGQDSAVTVSGPAVTFSRSGTPEDLPNIEANGPLVWEVRGESIRRCIVIKSLIGAQVRECP